MKEVTYIVIDYDELDYLINKHFDPVGHGQREYECVPENEWNNDSSYTVGAGPHVWVVDEEDEEIEKWLNGTLLNYYKNPRPPSLDTIMNRMARDGVLEPGDYLVSVCW